MGRQLTSTVPAQKTLADLRRIFDRWGKTYSVRKEGDRRSVTLEFEYLGRPVFIRCYSQATYELNLRQVFLVADALRIWDDRGVMASALGFFEQVKDLVGARETQEAQEQALLDAYALLGVSPDTPRDVIESAWKAWNRRLHPDLVTDPEEKARREERLKEINTAWTTIKEAKEKGGA